MDNPQLQTKFVTLLSSGEAVSNLVLSQTTFLSCGVGEVPDPVLLSTVFAMDEIRFCGEGRLLLLLSLLKIFLLQPNFLKFLSF